MRNLYDFFEVLSFQKRIVAAATKYIRKYDTCRQYSSQLWSFKVQPFWKGQKNLKKYLTCFFPGKIGLSLNIRLVYCYIHSKIQQGTQGKKVLVRSCLQTLNTCLKYLLSPFPLPCQKLIWQKDFFLLLFVWPNI